MVATRINGRAHDIHVHYAQRVQRLHLLTIPLWAVTARCAWMCIVYYFSLPLCYLGSYSIAHGLSMSPPLASSRHQRLSGRKHGGVACFFAIWKTLHRGEHKRRATGRVRCVVHRQSLVWARPRAHRTVTLSVRESRRRQGRRAIAPRRSVSNFISRVRMSCTCSSA